MKVKATYKTKGLNPFKLRFDPEDMYKKTVDVPDDTDWEQLEQFAKDDTADGYEFIRIEKTKD